MRRSSYNTRNPYLPMTEEDVVRRLLHQKTRRLMRKRKKAIGKWLARVNSPSFVLVAICAMFAAAALVHFLWRRHPTHPLHHSITNLSPDNPVVQKGDSAAAATGGRRALTEQFPSLEYALSHSKLVALYFAASWCPMSTPVSEMLDHEDFAALLVPPPPSPDAPLDKEPDKRSGSASPFVSLVYVGSDRSHEQMTQYLQHRPRWMHVPYDSVDRTKLKQHFQTAAKVEMKDLGMDSRKHEIPTVIVIDAGSQQVLTFSGVKDVEEHGARNAVDTWLELAKLSQALDAKFASREADDDPTAD